MTQDQRQAPDDAAGDLVEGAERWGPTVIPTAVAPAARLRSPIMEHRPIELPPPDDDRPTLVLPPLRAMAGPFGLAMLAAAPLFLIAGWQAAVVAAVVAPALGELHRRMSQVGGTFGEGFLPYRPDPGWPRGVQEEDEVRWNWSPVRDGRSAQG